MEKPQDFNNGAISKKLMFFLILLAFAVFGYLYISLPANDFDILTENFNRIAVGVSALAAILLGQYWVRAQDEKEKRIKGYLKKYPHNRFDKDWTIVEPNNLPGAYYLLEKKNETIHHILNMKTVYDLGWHVYLQYSQKIKDNKFREYNVGDKIRTQGEAGE